jgi:resuscitation-promoting factor RpfB
MSKRSKQFAKKYNAHKKRIKRLRRHPFAIPVATFVLLFFITLAAFVSLGGQTIGPGDARLVNVYVDGKEQTLPTRAQTVGDLLKRLDITLGEKDVVEPSADTPILEDDFKINVYRARPVTVEEGGKRVTLLTIQTDTDKLAQDAGFTVYPEDDVVPAPPQNVLRDGVVGQQLIIDRAPVIAVNLYGSVINIRTKAKTVGEALKEKGIITQTDDTIVPSMDTPLTPETKVSVTNQRKQVITAEEAIEMPVETIDDPALAMGSRVVKHPGTPGKKVVTYELKLENGKEVGRTILQTIVVAEPVKQVVAKGTKVITLTGSKADWMAGAGISPSDYAYVDFIIGHESGWRPNAVSANRCIGLGQRCNAQILISACPNWQTDPVCQLRHFSGYSSRYGGWSGAYSFWLANHWW